MKNIFAVFLALALAATSQFALAAAAQITALQGKVEATPQTGATRTLKYGDTINELDTIQTGANSTVVLRFEDGHIAALSANSRMKVSVYTYDFKDPAKGRVLLSLLAGGMRSITGQIGKTRPDRVAYQSGIYTIDILGTDVSFVFSNLTIVVVVNNGTISLTVGGKAYPIDAPNAALGNNGTVTADNISGILAKLQGLDGGPAMSAAMNYMNDGNWLLAAVQSAQTVQESGSPKTNYTCGVSCN